MYNGYAYFCPFIFPKCCTYLLMNIVIHKNVKHHITMLSIVQFKQIFFLQLNLLNDDKYLFFTIHFFVHLAYLLLTFIMPK